MLLLAILTTMVAVAWTALVLFANGMRTTSNGVVIGKSTIIAAWCLAVFFWCAWGLDKIN